MPGHQRLGQAQALVNVTDADLAGRKEPENSNPGRIGERLEDDVLLIHM